MVTPRRTAFVALAMTKRPTVVPEARLRRDRGGRALPGGASRLDSGLGAGWGAAPPRAVGNRAGNFPAIHIDRKPL
jgi:hypothetical protein